MADSPLDAEDLKILTLARVARSRAYAPHTGQSEGAAVRDTDGRTYAAATVENADPVLTTSALRAALAAAASSGARSFEAAALVSRPDLAGPSPQDEAVLREFAVPVLLIAGPDGALRTRHHAGSDAGSDPGSDPGDDPGRR